MSDIFKKKAKFSIYDIPIEYKISGVDISNEEYVEIEITLRDMIHNEFIGLADYLVFPNEAIFRGIHISEGYEEIISLYCSKLNKCIFAPTSRELYTFIYDDLLEKDSEGNIKFKEDIL